MKFSQDSQNLEELTCKIQHIVFENKQSSFYILKVKVNGPSKVMTVRGSFPGLSIGPGLKIQVRGRYEDNSTYGRQFVASSCEIVQELGKIGITSYLMNHVRSIGPITASKLYDVFGDELLKVLDETPDRIRELPFLTKVQTQSILDEWRFASSSRVSSIFLTDLGLSPAQVKSAISTFGASNVRSIIEENPYKLCACPGIEFVTADFVARKLGIGVDSSIRIRHMVLYFIRELSQIEGHTYLTSKQILDHSKISIKKNGIEPFSNGCELSDILFYPAIMALKDNGDVHIDGYNIYTASNWTYESESAKQIAEIVKYGGIEFDVDGLITEFETQKKLVLSDDQRRAISLLKESRVCVISGYPGTGKTTMVSAFVHIFERMHMDYALMSPTGIAAKRLSSITNKPAYTIHRALGCDKNGKWEFNSINKYVVDAVILDESCLPYRQYVNLADGTKEYIGSIVNNRKPVSVLSFNKEKNQVESRKVTNWFKYERKGPIYKIHVSDMATHRNSRLFKCTGNHKIYVEGGQKKASDLIVGDEVIVRGKFMNDLQRSFILGSLLGDAYCGKHSNKSCSISFVHGEDQKEYLSFKARLFDASVYTCKGGFNPRKRLYHSTISRLEEAHDLYELIYINGRKTITREWLDKIDVIGLAAWYMDDGHLYRQFNKRKSKNATLSISMHTEGFTYDENVIICEWLKEKWNITASVYDNKKGHYYIRFFAESSIRFWDMIRPYVIPSMSYKIPGGNCNFDPSKQIWKETKVFPVRKIESYIPKDCHQRWVYDIEVEGNHNYFSNNVLVSNSMCDSYTFFHLITSLRPSTVLIMIGDVAQLPSVGSGYVLHQLMQCDKIPHVSLTKIYRQEGCSDIIEVAHSILRGESVDTSYRKESEFVFSSIPTDRIVPEISRLTSFMKDKKVNFQVMAPVYDGEFGVNSLNKHLRKILNPSYVDENSVKIKIGDIEMYEGDRVMVVKNDYDRMIFNGDTGKVQRISIKQDEVEIKIFNWFDPGSINSRCADKIFTFKIDEARSMLRVAYACTAHKCVAPDTLVETPDGLVHISEISNEGVIATPTGHKDYRNKIFEQRPKKLVRMITSGGYILEATFDHGIDVWDKNDGYVRRQMSELSIGDTVALRLGCEWPNQPLRCMPKGSAYCDGDMAEFLGFLVARGTVTDHVAFSTSCKYVSDCFSGLCRTLFNLSVECRNRSGVYITEVKSHNLVQLVNATEGLQPCGDSVPSIILKSPMSVQARFLRGLFGCGVVYKRSVGNTKYYSIILDVRGRKAFRDIKVMLLRFGIPSRCKGQKSIVIYGAHIHNFAKYIGFVNPSRQCITFTYDCNDTDRIPILESERNILHIDGDPRTNTIAKDVLLSLLDTMSNDAMSNDAECETRKSVCHKLYQRVDFHHDRIKRIEIIKGPSMCVEVPDGHRFIQNGFCAYNCQGNEFDYVILPMTMKYGIMLYRNLIYTAITRAKKKVFVYGDPLAFDFAIKNDRETIRNSNLSGLITRMLECTEQT